MRKNHAIGLSLKCPGAPSYEVFMLGRILQGTGSSSIAIILAIFRDCYEKEEERLKVLNSREMLESNMDMKVVVPLHPRAEWFLTRCNTVFF